MTQDLSQLCGWSSDRVEEAFAEFGHRFVPFACTASPTVKGPPIWEFAKKVNGGKHLPTWFQETGDCVSMGFANAGQYLSAMQIALKRVEQKFRLWFPPYIYGTSRVDIGKGALGRGAGSTGTWAIEAARQHGILFMDDAGVPSYSGGLADQWGYRGVPSEFKTIAKDNPLKDSSRLTTVDQIKASLDNYRPCTYAIDWYYGQGAVTKNGYRALQRGRYVGGHQVCLLYWNDEIDGAFLMNSWGETAHQGVTSAFDEPKGGAYVLRADIERDLAQRNSEVFSLNVWDGDPTEAWYGLFGPGSQ